MPDPVTPNGAITLPLEPSKVLTVKAGAGASGSIAVFNGQTVETKEQITANATKTYGPFASARLVRIFAQAGTISYQVAASVSALPALAQAVVSEDGKTISGIGVKPATAILVYMFDTGVQLGTPTSLADGSWSLSLKTALSQGDRIGYDPTVIGPVTTVGAIVGVPGQVAQPTLGTATDTTQPISWSAPTTGGAPDDYTLEYRVAGQAIWTEFPTAGTDTSATVTGLTAATAYQYRITASNGAGAGLASAVASGSTAAAQPPGTAPDLAANFDDESNLPLKSSTGV